MSSLLHPIARQQAHHFFQVLWDELPTTWHVDIDYAEFEFSVWLAAFASICHDQKLSGFARLKAARQRAEKYYQQELRQVHHTPMEWLNFRFFLEMAMLVTARITPADIAHCYSWNNLLIETLVHTQYDRLELPPHDPSSETPV